MSGRKSSSLCLDFGRREIIHRFGSWSALQPPCATVARLSADASYVAERRSVACLKNFSDFASVGHEFWTGLLGSSAAVTHTNASRKLLAATLANGRARLKNSGWGTYRIVYARGMAAFSYIEGYDEGKLSIS